MFEWRICAFSMGSSHPNIVRALYLGNRVTPHCNFMRLYIDIHSVQQMLLSRATYRNALQSRSKTFSGASSLGQGLEIPSSENLVRGVGTV